MSRQIYTIGHSNHSMEQFLALLRQHGITAVADVRSQPYSSYTPQFSQNELKFVLKTVRIAYTFLGKELGARSDNRACYQQGKVQFDLLAREPLFIEGLQRIRQGIQKKYSISLMCSEKDPLECHRAILVARHLHDKETPVSHILDSGDLQAHVELEKRMLILHKLDEPDLFDSPETILERAYQLHGKRIAYQMVTNKPSDHEPGTPS